MHLSSQRFNRIIAILAILSTVSVFAYRAAASSLPGAFLGSKITVGDTNNTYAIADTNYLEGGHMQVATHAALLAITRERREVGMLVTVVDDDTGTVGNQTVTYRLISNPTADGSGGTATPTTDANWTVIIPSLGGNGGKFLTTDGTTVSWATVSGGGGGGTYTAGTGLTLTGSAFSVNTSQNIATLSNLTTDGFVRTTGANGTLTSAPLSSAEVASALGYTPYNASTNSSGYIAGNLTGAITSVGNATSLGSFTSANLSGALTDETGSGAAVFANSPTFVTPTLGAANATSVNGLSLTANPTGFAIAGGSTTSKTLTISNSLTLAGTDGSTLNIGTGGTLGSAAFTNASAYEVPLTFSTGLTRTGNTITVNASQNISTLSNLTSNGLIKTTGGTGALSIAAADIDYSTPTGVETITNKDFTSGTNTFPTFNQNTTGSAATLTTARLIAGNSFNGSANVPFANKFIVQGTSDAGLTGAQFLGALATGLLKNTTTTGVLSVATPGSDYEVPLTFSTGLTRTVNTITVNTSQNISTLSNLTSNGFVTTSGGTGALSVTGSTGSGNVVLATSPTLVTPVLGAATATSINKVAFTAPATGATLTIADGKTLTASNSLTFAGSDGSTLNVGSGGTLGTAAYTSSSAYEVPLTFSTGLTRTVNTITVNTSQNIATLSNLTSNGSVQTSGGNGTLSVVANTGTGNNVLANSPSLTSPSFSTIVNTGTLTLPTSTDTLVGRATTDTLTNKTISGSNNTLTNIPNSALTNSSLTLALGTSGTDVNWGASTVSLGGTATLNIPDASATARGLITTGAQTIAGAKTFSSSATFSAYTSGSVPYISTGGLLAQDNANFFYDGINHRLGLGTTSPSAFIHVLGTTEQLRLGYDASNYGSFTTGNTGGLTVTTTGTNANVNLSPATGIVTVNGTIPEQRFVTSGDSNYARFQRSTASDQFVGKNNVLQSGGVGKAITVTLGANRYLQASDAGLPTGSSITLSFSEWYKWTSGSVNVLFSYGPATSNNQLTFYLTSTTGVLATTGGSPLGTVSMSGTPNDGNWHHIVVVINGSSLTVYTDNISHTATLTAYNITLSGTFQNYQPTTALAGALDQELVYNRVLSRTSGAGSSDEIAQLYNGGSGTASIPTTGLIRRYDFEEGTGTTANDTNPNGTQYPLTLINGPTWTLNGFVPVSASSTESPFFSVSDGLTNAERGIATWGDFNGRNQQQGKWFQWFQNGVYPLASNNSGQWLFNPNNSSNTAPTIASTIDVAGNLTIGATYAGVNAAPTNGLLVQGNVGIGTTTANGTLSLGGNQTAAAWGTTGINFSTAAATYTNSSTAANGTVANSAVNSFGVPTLAASNTGVTSTTASTLYIAGAPVAGTNMTITNPLALYVATGNASFGGNVGIGTTSPTARLQLGAGTATAGTAPLKFASGTNLATPEAGAMEFDGTQLYFSPSTTRNIVAQVSGGTPLTAGSIPFATASGYFTQNNNNFYIQNSSSTPMTLATNTNVAFSVNTNGDFTGTDAVNIYGQYDAYLPNSAITNSLTGLNTDGAFPGYGVSSSRGTGQSPVQLQTGDLVGGFFGFGAQGASSPTYQNLGGMAVTTIGSSTNNLGGQLNFYTKADGGSLTQHLSIDNAGVLSVSSTTPEQRFVTSGDSNYARFQRSTASDQFVGKNNVLQSGGSGQAIVFNSASSQYFTAPDTGLPTGSSIALTVSQWIKYNGGVPANLPLLYYGTGSTSLTAFIVTNSGQVAVYNGNTALSSAFGVRIDDGKWHHVVLTINGSALTVYIDNVSYTGTLPAYTVATGASMVNNNVANSTFYFSYSLDQLLVYNRVLSRTSGAGSSDEISQLYNSGAGTASISTTNLLRRYDFEEGTGSTVSDTNPNGTQYQMTLVNSPSWTLNGIVPIGASSTETSFFAIKDGLTNAERGIATWGDFNGRNQQQGKWFQWFQNGSYPLASNNSGQWLFNPSNNTNGVPTIASTIDVAGNITVGAIYAGVNAAPTNGLLVQGNVGIGTAATTVASKLHILTTALGTTQANSSGIYLQNNTAAAAGAQQISPGIVFEGQGWKTNATAASQAVDFREFVVPVQGTANPTGYLSWGSSVNGAGYTDGLLALTTGGNLGIGTTAPSGALSVGGNRTASAWGVNGINLQTVAATYTDSSTAANGTVTNTAINSFGIPTVAATNSSVTYTNYSNLYIAGAPLAGTNVSLTNRFALNVAGGSSFFGGSVGISTAGTPFTPSFTLQVGDGAVSGIVARFQNSAGTCDINPLTSSLACSSDMNLKKNITNLSDGSAWSFSNNISVANDSDLDKILALNPVTYNWNVEQDTDQKHIGFIAQDVQQIFPDLVATDPNTHLLSLNYIGFIPYTIEAIKEINFNITAIDDLTKSNTWRDALIGWFADSANGIKSLVVHDKVCVDDQCLTKSDIQRLLQLENQQGGTTTVSNSSSNTTSSTTTDSSTDTTSQTQSPDVTAPAPDTTTTSTASPAPDTTTSTDTSSSSTTDTSSTPPPADTTSASQ